MAPKKQALILDPPSKLHFKASCTEVATTYLSLTNPTDRDICFNVKTTVPKEYCVRPNRGTIQPKKTISVSVMLQPLTLKCQVKVRHKFMIQSIFAPEEKYDFDALWKNTPDDNIMSSRLDCVFDIPDEVPEVLRELLSQSGSGDDSSSSARNTSLLEDGLKVVRGPDWKWENEDGGEGHVGTVVEIRRTDKKVYVVWDNGFRGNYRIGFNNAYDVRTLDNGSIGVNHPTVTCNSCRKKGVIGIRWKCKVCYDYDLCSRCYMSDKHDVTHPFTRFQTYNENKIDVPKRQGSVKIQMKGMFASAKVVRGHDWKWERQDGGPGKTGIITDVCGWNDDTDWNACHVAWTDNDSSNMYRIGHEGKVDLKYVQEACEGYYYRDHLPVTGDETRAVKENVSANTEVKEVYSRRNESASAKATVQEFGSTTGSTLLSQNLKDLFFSDKFSDLTLKVQDRSFHVHKAILCARSSVFASKILGDNRGASTLVIRDCDQSTFEDVLFYLYTGKLKRLSYANVDALYEAADKFEIQALKEECIRFKKEGLSVDYVSEFLAVA